jgi:ubiquinone/menaquinone biosynthesis C-methylase UbiE
MPGVKLGDRLLVMGCSDPRLIAALAAKAGLTGRTCIVDESDQVQTRAASAVEREGVLVESFAAPMTSLPFEAGAFDVVVMRNILPAIEPDRRLRASAEAHRVLRPGGRCLVIDDGRRSGWSSLVGGARRNPDYGAGGPTAVLNQSGFRGARVLAEREGLLFAEGVKPNL